MPNAVPMLSPLRIDGATLRLVRLPLVTPFTIATGTLTEKVFPLLTLRAGGLEGRHAPLGPRREQHPQAPLGLRGRHAPRRFRRGGRPALDD